MAQLALRKWLRASPLLTLAQLRWSEDKLRDRLQHVVATEHQGPHTLGIIDETSDPKKGDKTPGVQKQWCGRLGKTENCLVTVHVGFACGDFHCLLDGELFLPESWDADRQRCREAGIPDDMHYRPKWQIALELRDRAVGRGISFDWFTVDEGYGSKPEFLRALTARNQRYVAEVPRSLTGWLKRPRVVTRPYHKNGRGPGRKVPRLASDTPRARRVDALMNDARVRDQPWRRFRVKDGEKGPMVWECQHVMLTVKDDDGLPGETLHLLIARNVLNPREVKFFVSNAPPETGVGTLLLVAFSRWRVERCFEDQKSEIGLDQYEGRRYLGLKRHLIISCVSYLFLARMRQEWGKKAAGADGVSAAYGDGGIGPFVGIAVAPVAGADSGEGGAEDRLGAASQGHSAQKSHERHSQAVAQTRHQTLTDRTLSMGYNLAL